MSKSKVIINLNRKGTEGQTIRAGDVYNIKVDVINSTQKLNR